MGISSYKMAQQLGYPSTQGYIQFENAKKAVSLEKLITLWKISKLSADEFMQMIESEVVEKNKQRKK